VPVTAGLRLTVPGSARRDNEACRSSSDGLPSSDVFSGSGLRESWIRAECAERLSTGPISKAATIATRNQAARPIGTHHHGFTLPPRGYLPCSHVLSHRVTAWSRLAIPTPAPSNPGETCRSSQVGPRAPMPSSAAGRPLSGPVSSGRVTRDWNSAETASKGSGEAWDAGRQRDWRREKPGCGCPAASAACAADRRCSRDPLVRTPFASPTAD